MLTIRYLTLIRWRGKQNKSGQPVEYAEMGRYLFMTYISSNKLDFRVTLQMLFMDDDA